MVEGAAKEEGEQEPRGRKAPPSNTRSAHMVTVRPRMDSSALPGAPSISTVRLEDGGAKVRFGLAARREGRSREALGGPTGGRVACQSASLLEAGSTAATLGTMKLGRVREGGVKLKNSPSTQTSSRVTAGPKPGVVVQRMRRRGTTLVQLARGNAASPL